MVDEHRCVAVPLDVDQTSQARASFRLVIDRRDDLDHLVTGLPTVAVHRVEVDECETAGDQVQPIVGSVRCEHREGTRPEP
jgi:hypothetical protein